MRVYICDVGRLLTLYGVKAGELAEYIGAAKSTVSEWVSGKKTPRVDKYGSILDAIEALGYPEALKLKPLTGIEDLIREVDIAEEKIDD